VLPAMLTLLAWAANAPDGHLLTSWRTNVTLAPVSPNTPRHTIHSYFNTCPESPDGTKLVVFASDDPTGETGDVVIRDRATGDETTIARSIHVEDAHRVACQQWASGGRRVVYHGQHGDEWLVWVYDLVTGQERVLARDRLAGWGTPDGDLVPLYGLHWSPGEHRDLELANVATGEIRAVFGVDAATAASPWVAKTFGDRPLSIFFPVLSPNAERIFFKLASPAGGDPRSGKASDRYGLVCYDLAQRKVLLSREQWGHPAWHPDGRTVIESHNKRIDVETGEVNKIPELPDFGAGHPSVSPDGRLMVTDTLMDKLGGQRSDWGIVVADLQTGEMVLLDQFSGTGGARSWRGPHPHPIFSADGRRIYYNVNRGPWTTLMVAERSD